jgi:archaellum biogenesis protein FlaJ (TadC family)
MLWNTKAETEKDFARPYRRPPSPKSLIIKKLDFSETQIKAYGELIKEHRKIVKQTIGDNKRLKEELYGMLSLSITDTNVEKIINEISDNEKNLEIATFEHFKKVRDLCNEEQKEKFDKLIIRVIETMSFPKRPPQRPRE